MSTLECIKNIVIQIMDESDVRKPDIYCSEDVFLELTKRPDCQIHPTKNNTIVMLPNVYWVEDTSLTIPNIVANTHRGELLLKYLELVDYFMLEENGSIDDIQNIVKELINQRK